MLPFKESPHLFHFSNEPPFILIFSLLAEKYYMFSHYIVACRVFHSSLKVLCSSRHRISILALTLLILSCDS